MSLPGIFLSNFQGGGGAFEILGLFLKQISDLLKKLWTFQYAAGFRGPGILIKRSTFVDVLHVTYKILDLFGLSKFKGGNAPLAPPPDKNIPAFGGKRVVLGLYTMTEHFNRELHSPAIH